MKAGNEDDDMIVENMYLDEVLEVIYVAVDQFLKHNVDL
jgi:hypothetical protein